MPCWVNCVNPESQVGAHKVNWSLVLFHFILLASQRFKKFGNFRPLVRYVLSCLSQFPLSCHFSHVCDLRSSGRYCIWAHWHSLCLSVKQENSPLLYPSQASCKRHVKDSEVLHKQRRTGETCWRQFLSLLRKERTEAEVKMVLSRQKNDVNILADKAEGGFVYKRINGVRWCLASHSAIGHIGKPLFNEVSCVRDGIFDSQRPALVLGCGCVGGAQEEKKPNLSPMGGNAKLRRP